MDTVYFRGRWTPPIFARNQSLSSSDWKNSTQTDVEPFSSFLSSVCDASAMRQSISPFFLFSSPLLFEPGLHRLWPKTQSLPPPSLPPSLPPFQSFAMSLVRCRRGKVGQHPEGPFTHPSVLETARQLNVVSNFRRAVPRAATFQLTALWRRKEVKLSTHLSSWLHAA